MKSTCFAGGCLIANPPIGEIMFNYGIINKDNTIVGNMSIPIEDDTVNKIRKAVLSYQPERTGTISIGTISQLVQQDSILKRTEGQINIFVTK